MTPRELPNVSVAVQDYARIWAESTSRVLEQVSGTAFISTPRSPALDQASPQNPATATEAQASEPTAESAAPAAPLDRVSIRFKVAGRLSGAQLFRLSPADAVRLAQILMSEPVDPSVQFAEGHIEALHELLRQFAGLAASASKAKYGGDVEFSIDTSEAAAFETAATAVWEFSSSNIAAIRWALDVDSALSASLESAIAAQAAVGSAPTPPQPKTQAATSPSGPSPAPSATAPETAGSAANLDLLLDVLLEATLRFGQKEMQLREILELRPGSVVELNRRIQEPAELLVSGRVVARGDVVIVDGNYGLRITDITQPHQRLESLETGSGA